MKGFAGAWGLGLQLLRHQKRARASGECLSRAESSEVILTGTIFLGGTARRKLSGARSHIFRSVTNTQAVLRPAWGGLAKGNQSVQQAEGSVVSGKSKSVGVISQGFPGAWGPGLAAGASRGLGPGPLGAWGPGH